MDIRLTLNVIQILFLGMLIPTVGLAVEQVSGTDGNDTVRGAATNDELAGHDGNDLLKGGDGDDLLEGGNGDDELRGENGNDVLIGGSGIDRLYGGLGADRFVIDIDASLEADVIMDFKPEEGDTIWLELEKSARFRMKDKKKMPTKIKAGNVQLDYKKVTIENVRIDYDGDVEVQFKGKSWVKVVGIKRSDLKVKAKQDGQNISFTFTKRF
jgi:hypothetical protein